MPRKTIDKELLESFRKALVENEWKKEIDFVPMFQCSMEKINYCKQFINIHHIWQYWPNHFKIKYNQLKYLVYFFSNDNKHLIWMAKDLQFIFKWDQAIFNVFSDMVDFIEYEFTGIELKYLVDYSVLFYWLLLVHKNHCFENSESIIGVKCNYDKESGYDFDTEVLNYRATLFDMFHALILNHIDKRRKKKYNDWLMKYSAFFKEYMNPKQDLLRYIDRLLEKEDRSISIYWWAIKNHWKIILKFHGKQAIVINALNNNRNKCKEDVSWISIPNLLHQSWCTNKAALWRVISRIRTKITEIWYWSNIKIICIKWSYKLRIIENQTNK